MQKTLDDIMIEGWRAANAGIMWWNNPYASGSAEAGVWDKGHTQWRNTHNRKGASK